MIIMETLPPSLEAEASGQGPGVRGFVEDAVLPSFPGTQTPGCGFLASGIARASSCDKSPRAPVYLLSSCFPGEPRLRQAALTALKTRCNKGGRRGPRFKAAGR